MRHLRRSALPCNAMYLERYKASEPDRLAKAAAFETDGKAPTLVGANYIHPTARIHPTAKVSPRADGRRTRSATPASRP